MHEAATSGCRVLVFAGAGDAFCAGLDLSVLQTMMDKPVEEHRAELQAKALIYINTDVGVTGPVATAAASLAPSATLGSAAEISAPDVSMASGATGAVAVTITSASSAAAGVSAPGNAAGLSANGAGVAASASVVVSGFCSKEA